MKKIKTSPLGEVREMYEANADSYSKMMDNEIELPIYKDILERLQKKIVDIPGVLVDTACGSGHMLEMFHLQYDSDRDLLGVDISPRMVALSGERLSSKAKIILGDMRALPEIESASAAAVMNFFAVHHLDKEDILSFFLECKRILVQNGQLFIAAWEGRGAIDYGEESDINALRYSSSELSDLAMKAGFLLNRCAVEAVEDFPMDAIYMECTKEN